MVEPAWAAAVAALPEVFDPLEELRATADRALAGAQFDRTDGEPILVRLEQQGVGAERRQALQMAMMDGELTAADRKLLDKYLPRPKADELRAVEEVLLPLPLPSPPPSPPHICRCRRPYSRSISAQAPQPELLEKPGRAGL